MKSLKITALILAVVLLLLLLLVFVLETRADKVPVDKQDETTTDAPETTGTLSWEDYLALSLEEQDAFFQQFQSAEDFEKWMEEAKQGETTNPDLVWDKSGKLPSEYTWEEYEALANEEKDAFYLWFESEDAFERWMEAAKPAETTTPEQVWDKPGKLPSEYTWKEYEALTNEEKDAFYLWFDSADAFERWMEAVKPAETTAPDPVWDKPGKLPSEYTWEEYEALTNEEKDAFYLWFDSADAFEQWMEAAKPAETTTPDPIWDKPGKLPSEYTWEEYEALTNEEKDAFYLWFGSTEAFEEWMESVR